MVFFVVKWDEEVYFLLDVIVKVGELGFCGFYILEEVGGLGFLCLDVMVVFEELVCVCILMVVYFIIYNMVSWMVVIWGYVELKEEWCE